MCVCVCVCGGGVIRERESGRGIYVEREKCCLGVYV